MKYLYDKIGIITLLIFMQLDYILTKIGVDVGFITGGNGLMGWLIDLPYASGIFVRFCMAIILCGLIYYIKTKNNGYYRSIMEVAAICYGFVYLCHFAWIILYVWS